ncbi:MAG: Hsp20/alpha crystallin family protein [Oscillospiraceae bacterium]|nr:Hsp20/alpha crystallin family protein [Oscillospiraceae bacterium]MCR5805833.1 Hsp20/alpha crystallin family protein [Oscillospiraceae bacterium]
MYRLTPFTRNIFDAVNDLDRSYYDHDDKVFSCRTDILEDEDKFTMELEMPGFTKEDIKVDIDGSSLTVKAEHAQKKEEPKGARYIRRERIFGTYQRSFDISGIDTEAVSAAYKNGILILTLPKKKAVTPPVKTITIS